MTWSIMLSATSVTRSDSMRLACDGWPCSCSPMFLWIRLIARAMFKEISDRSAGKGLPLTTIQEIADQVASGTFGTHLGRVSDGLPGDTGEIANEINEARNGLLHWRRDRFSLPVYKGENLTTEEGFRSCMDDVLRFIQLVPFDLPTGGGASA
jgi:hypothetical protein